MKQRYLIITILLSTLGLIVLNHKSSQNTVQIQNLQKSGVNRFSATLINKTHAPVNPQVEIAIKDHIKNTNKQFSFQIEKIQSNEKKDIEFTIDEKNEQISLRTVSVLLSSPAEIVSKSITDVALPSNQFTQFLALSPFVFGVGLLVISKLV